MNDLVRGLFTSRQNGEIKFWQEMVGGGAAGASQVVSGLNRLWMALTEGERFLDFHLGVYQSSRDRQDSFTNPR